LIIGGCAPSSTGCLTVPQRREHLSPAKELELPTRVAPLRTPVVSSYGATRNRSQNEGTLEWL